MNLEGLVESKGTMPDQVVAAVRQMVEREVVGVLVDLAMVGQVERLIERAEAALAEVRARREDLEGEQDRLKAERDRAEQALIDARGQLDRVSFTREMRAGTHSAQAMAIREARSGAQAAVEAADRVYQAANEAERAVRLHELPGVRTEDARLSALLVRLRQVKRPELGLLRGALETVLAGE